MTIELRCPSGHLLKAKDSLAGQTVACPRCQAQVQVPSPPAPISDQDILEFLGPAPTAKPSPVGLDSEDAASSAGAGPTPTLLRLPTRMSDIKPCPKCKREVRAGFDICPHCKTYFTDLKEIRRRMTGA